MSRGEIWARTLLEAPAPARGTTPSLVAFDGSIAGLPWRAASIVPNETGRFPRARGGEAGLDEALALADAVRDAPDDAAILAIVDVPGQAFGRREEAAGIHLALAAAVDAYATRRRAGTPVFALLVGRAISGAFLAHGMQAGWIGALRDPGVDVHVMSARSVARVTRATPEEVARVATVVPATARNIETFARFGAIDELFDVRDPAEPTARELALVRASLARARAAGLGTRAPRERLAAPTAARLRSAAIDIRARIDAAWDA